MSRWRLKEHLGSGFRRAEIVLGAATTGDSSAL
jgi:hypothetical protein